MNYGCNRGFLTCLSWFYRIDRRTLCSQKFLECLGKIPVRNLLGVLFGALRFSKASFKFKTFHFHFLLRLEGKVMYLKVHELSFKT